MSAFQQKLLSGAVFAAALVAAPLSAQASIVVFSGQDNGAATTGPFPNSATAQASFLLAASGFGSVATETFEELAVGTAATGGSFPIPGAIVSLVTSFDVPFGGVNNAASTNLYGFNVTPGGANWLAFSDGSATFSFTNPSHSFGFFTSGVQNTFTTSLTLTFNDGTSEVLNVPINAIGGVSFYGITDSAQFASITISNLTGDDAWGIDNVSYNIGASAAASVPEPLTLSLLASGLAGATLMRRRRKV